MGDNVFWQNIIVLYSRPVLFFLKHDSRDSERNVFVAKGLRGARCLDGPTRFAVRLQTEGSDICRVARPHARVKAEQKYIIA